MAFVCLGDDLILVAYTVFLLCHFSYILKSSTIWLKKSSTPLSICSLD